MAKRLSKRAVKKIHELREQGLSDTKIAKQMERSLPTIYRVLNSTPSAPAATKKSATGNGIGSEIEAIVRREVDARLKRARDAGIRALTTALKI